MYIKTLLYQEYELKRRIQYRGPEYKDPSREVVNEKLDLLNFERRSIISMEFVSSTAWGGIHIQACEKDRLHVWINFWWYPLDEKHKWSVHMREPIYRSTDYEGDYFDEPIDRLDHLKIEASDPSMLVFLDQTVPRKLGLKMLKHFVEHGKFPADVILKGDSDGIDLLIEGK